MNEKQRMQYLDAMGIDCFVPRFLLPNAKAPQQCELPSSVLQSSAANGSSKSTETAAAEAKPARSMQAAGEGLKQFFDSQASSRRIIEASREEYSSASPEGKQQSAAPGDASASSANNSLAATSSQEAPRFALSLWQIDGVYVIDSRRPKDAFPTQTLLRNMLKAAGWLARDLPKAETLNWPMVAHSERASWADACAMVQDFLEARLAKSESELDTLLLFGEAATRTVFGEHSDYSDMCFKPQTLEKLPDHKSAKALVLPSLAHMLHKPEVKPKVWTAILAFQHNH